MIAALVKERMAWSIRPKAIPLSFRVHRSGEPPLGMASAGKSASSSVESPSQEAIEERFRALAACWLEETRLMSSLSKITEHKAYQEIIRMGPGAVPFILRDLEQRPGHWGPALQAITGAQPVPREHAGRLKAIAGDWIAWGKAHGYV